MRLTIPPGVFQSSRVISASKATESLAGGTDMTTSDDEFRPKSAVPLRSSSDPVRRYAAPINPTIPVSPRDLSSKRSFSQQTIRTRFDSPSDVTLRHPTFITTSYPYPLSPIRRSKTVDPEKNLSPCVSTRSVAGFHLSYTPSPTLTGPISLATGPPKTYQPLSPEDSRALNAFQLKL